jgi:hypothetical protein
MIILALMNSGILYHGDGLATKVAVKSLLTDQARGDANDDFVTEARLLRFFVFYMK